MRKAHAVFERAAIFVGALVGERRQELMRQIAVRAVQLDHVIADAVDALGGGGEFAEAALDVVLGHGVRHRPAGVVGDRRRRFRRPGVRSFEDRLAAGGRRRGRAFAAGMRELHAELGDAVLAAEIVHALERGFVLVGIHAGAFRRDAALRIDVGHLAHHQAGGAERHIAEMHQVPVVGRAVVGIVLAHRRHHDAVRQCETAQRDRRKQDASHWSDFLSSSGEFKRRVYLNSRCRRRNRRAWPPPGSRSPRTGRIRSRRYSTAICR